MKGTGRAKPVFDDSYHNVVGPGRIMYWQCSRKGCSKRHGSQAEAENCLREFRKSHKGSRR